ncbi:uncharacterized protein LOC100376626 isoform X2 [Saccoglossus kowalevskii]
MEKKREKTPESRLMVNTPDLQIMSLKKSNDEMRKHISKLKSDLEQERSNIKKIKRERVVDIRSAREKEYQRAMMAISDLRNKLHQEKINELLAQKDTLTRQYEMEVKKIVKQKEDSLGKMQSELHRTKEDLLVRMKHRIAADAQDEVKKKFEVERSKMQQEILELKESKRKIENEFNQISDAERRRIAENKWIQDKHILEMEQLRKETRRDICRMVDELKKKEKLVGELEKEVGHHSGHSRKLQAEKESLKDELSNIMKMADTWERSSTPGICSPRSKSPPTSPRPGTPRSIPSPRPPALGRLTPDAQALEDFERERFHCRLSELVHLVRRLEDENSKLQRAKEALEGKLKNADFTSERNKLNKIIEDLEHDKKRLENTCKTLNEENKKKISLSKLPIRRQESVGYGSRRSSSTDSSDNSEAEKFKKIMDDNFKTITELKNQIIEKDRRLDLIQHRRRKARRRQSGILESPKGLEDEIGLDTASITSSISQRSDNSISGEWDEFERAEMEGNYQQLSKEYLQLKKAYTQLQAMVGGSLDVQREFKLREQLELDLLDSQAKIEDFQKVIKDQGKDAGWVEEKQKFITYNRNLQSKVEEKEDAIKKVKRDLNDSRDQNELLEFRILELEERSESSHTAVPESLSSLSPSSPNTIVRRSPSPAALPLIQVTETDGISLQIAVNETGFTDMSVVDIKQKLEDIANNKDDDRLSVEDKKSLLQARAMLDIADLKLKKMTSSETSLKRKVMDLEHEKDRLAAKVSSTEVELRSNLNVLDDCNKKIDELEEIIEDRKKSESKFHAMEDVYLKNESKLKDEIKLLKKQMSSDKEGRDYENELLFQKIAEVRDEKQKVAILEESNSALQEKLDRVSDSSLQSKLDSLVKEDTLAAKEGAESKQIELKSVMTLEELQHLKAKVDEIKAAHQKIAEMEQTELVLRKHIEALEREIVELQENIQHHESSYNEKVEEYEIREHTLKEISRKAEQAEVQLKEQLDASISEDSKKGEQIQELCLKIKILESSETSSKQKFDSDAINQNLDTELKQLKSENEKLSNQLNSYELAEKELKGQINQIKVENDVLKDKLQLLEIENPNLKSLPGDKTDDDKENGDVLKMKDRIWELESSEKVLEADLFDLKEENEKLKSKLMNGDSEPMHSEIEVSETQEQTINDLRTSQTSLKEALSKTTSEKENLLKMYQDALEKLQELETDEKIDQSPSLDVTSEAQVQSSVEQPIERVTVENVSMPQNLLLNMDSQKEQSYADRVYELQASENVLKNIVKDLQVSEEELNNKIVELTSEKAELVAQLRDANLKDEESEKVIKEHENEVSMLKMKIGEIETTKEKLEEESALLTRQLEVANQKLQEVEERNAEVNKLNNDLQVSEAQMKEEMLEMSSEKEEIEVKLLEAREELKKTNERIDNLTASESNLSEQLNNVITEKETLAADLKESNVRLVNQEQRLESVIAAAGEEKVKVLTKENDELTQKLEEAENRIEEQDIQETVLKKIINELEDSEKTSRERIVELEESGKTVKAALDGQEKTSEDLREKLDEVEKSEKELQEKVLQLENSDKDLRDKLSELESAQLDSSNNEALMKEIKELELEVQRRKDIEVDLKEDHFEELTSLQEQIQDLERTNQELRKKLAELSEELECIDELKKEHLSEVSNLQGKIKDLENQNAEDSNKFEDLKQSLSMEIATLKEQVDDLENSERDIRSKLSQNSDALFKSQKSYEEDQKMWNEKEHHLKDQLSESEVVIKTLNEKVQALQQQEVTLKKEVEKQEEIKVKASEREIATYSLQERIAELQECESLLKAKIIELTESEESAKKNYQETLKDRIENEKAWKVKIKDLEDTEDKSRLRLQEMEVVEIDLREQLEAKVRENEVASEMWRQSEDLLNERVAELEELETVLKQRIQELEDNESHLKQEIKQKTKETENTWKQAAESSTLAYQERIHELEELEGDLKDRISQLAEAERTAKDMLQEATVVYRENEEALKERIEQLEEDQGEMQGQIHALENLKAMMRGQIEDAEQHNKETQKANKRLQEKIEQFESGEQAHKDELNRMKKQLETTEQAEKESQKLLSQQLEDIQTESKSNEKNLRDRVKELEYSDNELQNKLYETETVKTELEDRLESAEIENKRVKESNNHLKEQIDELEEENSKLRRDLEDTQEKADESERISSELKDRLHETESVGDMKKMEEQKSLEKIQKQIEELQMSEEMLKDDVEHLERSERKLKQKLTEKNADIDKLYQQRKVEKDEMRSRILDLEMSEMKLKEQVHVLDMEVKKKTWDIERIQPQIKFQTEQIDTVGKQEIKHKELANCLRKKVEQLEQREKDLKNDIMMASDSQSPLKEKLSRSERRETELVKKVERLEKSEETLKAAVLSLEQAKDTKTKKEIEELNEQVQQLEDVADKLRHDLKRSENSEKSIKKLHTALEDDFSYLKEEESKLRNRLKDIEKEKGQSKKRYDEDYEELQDKVIALEKVEQTLKKKLESSKKTEEALQKELNTAEEMFDKTENTLKQTNKALERKLKQLEEAIDRSQLREKELETSGNSLQQKLKMLEKSECALKDQVSELENQELNFKHQVRELESAERMLKMDNDQLKLEKDLLTDKMDDVKKSESDLQKKTGELQMNEKKLKEKVVALEKQLNVLREKVKEMETSAATMETRCAQASKLEKELSDTQDELQESHTKIDQLERAKASLKRQLENLEDDLATGQMITLPLEEYKRMKAQTGLLEMTEQSVEDLEKTEAKLQDKLKKMEEQKDYCDADKEILNLRLQLDEKNEINKELQDKFDESQIHLKTAQRQGADLRNIHSAVKKELNELKESLENGDILSGIYTKRNSKSTQTDALRYLGGTALQSRVYTPENKQTTLLEFLETLPYNAQIPKTTVEYPKSVLPELKLDNIADRLMLCTSKGLVDVDSKPGYFMQSATLQMEKTADLDKIRLIEELVEHLPQYETNTAQVKTSPPRRLYAVREMTRRTTIPDKSMPSPRALDTSRPYERKKLIEALVAVLPQGDPELPSEWIRPKTVQYGKLVDEPQMCANGVFRAEFNTDIVVSQPSPPPLPDTMPPPIQFQTLPSSFDETQHCDSPVPNFFDVNGIDSESDFSDVDLPPLPASEPPSASHLVIESSRKQATLHVQRPPSFDSGMETQSTGTDREYADENTSAFVFPVPGKPLTLPRVPSEEGPETCPKPPTPLWVTKMVQRQLSERDSHEAEKDQLKRKIVDLTAESEERAALLRDRDISYKIKEIEEIADLKYKLQEKEEALEEKCKLSKSLRMENTQLHAEFRDKNGQLTSLKAEVMRLERLLRGSHSDDGQVAALREELEGKQKQLQDKKEEMNKMTNLNDVYRTKLDRREKDLAAKEQELEQKNSELQKLRHEVGGLEQQKKIAQTSADSKYNELAGKYEALKQEFQAKCLELDSTLEELKSLKKKYEDLKNKLKDLEKIRDERDIILGKLQALEAALKLKADQEQKLFEELAMLTRKLEDYEKLNTTRDGIEESFREIKNNYDDMEHKKREAELAVAPLKAKVSRLVKKCKERDELIKKLTNELRQQHKGHPNELLEAVTKLQSRMPDEEYNEPMSPYSTTLHGIHEVSEVTRENSDVGVESSPSLSSLYTRRTPTLPTRMINELSEPLWQTIESSSPATVGRHQQLQLDVDNIQDTDEAAMQELLRSLSSDPIGSSSNRSTSSQVAATLPQTSATTRDRKSPGSALQELLTVDPELARMLDRGSNMGDGRDSGDMLQGTGSSERPRSSTPRRQRPRDSSHLRQSPEEILRLHSRLSETRSNPYEFNYEPSPSLAEEASQLEQLHNINSPMFIDGVPIATSPRLSMSLPQPVSSQPLSSKNLPQLSAPTLLSMGVQPTQNIGSVPAAFSSIPGTHNGNIPSSANGGVPTYLRGAGLDRPDLGSLSLSNSSMLSPAGLPTAALLPPTLACKSEGPPLSPSDFCISRIVSSRSVLLTWVPPAMDEMAKSNGAQVAGYRVYLNNKQKQLVNSAHLTKALIENIDIRIPVTFSIETVSVTGQTSHRVEMQFDGNMLSPFLTESMASESAADTEVSSIFSDFEEPQKRTFMAIYDYIPADHSPNDYPAFELQFNEGDIITIYGPPRPDGFYHGKLHGKKGLVPSNFIEEIHVSGNKGRKKKKSRSQGSLHNGHSSTASDSPRQRSGRNNRPPPGKNSLGGSRV